jgi:hypothetical protein
MRRRNKLLASALVVGVLGTVAAGGVFGLFSATTQNAGNELSTGTVSLTDNDGGSAQFNISNAKPGDSWTRCIKVTYSGTLPADVHHYTQASPNVVGPYLNLKFEEGTQATSVFPDCTGFTSATTLYNGGAAVYPGKNFATGAVTAPFGQSFWQPGDSVVFRTTMTLSAAAPDSVQGSSGGNVTVVWEARNH